MKKECVTKHESKKGKTKFLFLNCFLYVIGKLRQYKSFHFVFVDFVSHFIGTLVCLPYWILVDYIFVRFNLTYLQANNLRRISTMYVRGTK
jgi:hypothetical protein